jgi:hypothetical protein
MNPLNKAWLVLKELSSKDLEMASLTGTVPRLPFVNQLGHFGYDDGEPEWDKQWGHLTNSPENPGLALPAKFRPEMWDWGHLNSRNPRDSGPHWYGDELGDDSEEAHAANEALTLNDAWKPDHTMSDPNEIGEDSYRSTPSVQESYLGEPEQVSREKSYWDTRGNKHLVPEHLWTRGGDEPRSMYDSLFNPDDQYWGKKDDVPSDPEFKPYMDIPREVPEKVTQGPWRHENAQGFDDIAGNEEQMRPPTPKTPSLDYASYIAAHPPSPPITHDYPPPSPPSPPPSPPQRDAMAMLRERQMANIERLKAQRLGRMPGRRRRR